MSWSRRLVLRAGLGAGAAALAGCFRPMLAEDAPASALRGRVALPPISGRVGYHLSQRLEERLGRPSGPEYRLEVTLSTRNTGLAIAQDSSVTRRTVIATADWRLLRLGDPSPVIRRRQVARSGYNATTSLYAARVAERTVERRLAEELAERISREILANASALTEGGAVQ